MSKFEPTNEQDKVLSFKGKNMIVSASAGSGKTATLVEYISRLVKKGQPIKRILLLTFTKAASFEMKERLIANLYEETESDNVLSAIDDVATADISTIHSFLKNVLSKNTNSLPISDGFFVLSEEELQAIKEMAFLSAEQKFKQTLPEQYESLFLRLHSDRNKIFSLLENMLAFFATVQNSEEKIAKWKTSQKEHYKWTMQNLEKYFLPKIKKLLKNMSILKFKLDNDKYTMYINNFEVLLSPNKAPLQMLKDIAASNFKAPTTLKKVDPIALAELKEEYEVFKDIKKDLLSINIDDDRLYDENEFGSLESMVYDFYTIYERELASQKEKINAADFNDLEKYAAILLKNDEIKKQLQQDYDYVFIDEYQDTNYVQASIVKEIAKAAHFIAVGDPKQGIYGFRQATSEIIKNDIAAYEKAKKSSAEFLRKNFRSDPYVLDFVNNVFVNVMKTKTVGINYKKTSVLEAGKDGHLFDENLPAVRVDIIKKEKQEKENDFSSSYDIMQDSNFKEASKSLEAKVIANRVQDLLLKQIFDGKQEKMRDVTYKDICILTRGKSELVEEIIKELSERKIPVVSEVRGNFKDYSEVIVLINLFKLLLDEKDDASLLSVMLSKIGGFSVDEIARLRIDSKENEFFNIVKNSQDEKVVAFKKMIEDLKFKLVVKGAYVMLEDLFRQTNYRPYILSKENAENYLFVLEKFLEQIKRSGAEFDLPRLVSILQQEEINFKGGGNSSNAVSICTIHSSKGLEYPIVILADCGKTMTEASKDQFVLDSDFGLALDYFSQEDDTVLQTPMVFLLKNKMKERQKSDEIMLLYVALTRAQRHLQITGTMKEGWLDKLPKDPMDAKTYLEMILSSYRKLALPRFKKQLASSRVEVSEIESVEDIFVQEENFVGEVDETVVEKIKNYFDFSYPYEGATQTIFKNSVSSINEQGKVAVRRFVFDDEGDFIERGNAYHLALKEIDFAKVSDIASLESELKKLDDEGVKEYVDKNVLYNNITKLKEVLLPCQKIFKEQQFTSLANLKSVLGEGQDEEIMLQGVVDLFGLGEKNILIDYKFTTITDEKTLKNKYEKQLLLYKNAIENGYGVKVDEVYLLSLKNHNLIKF